MPKTGKTKQSNWWSEQCKTTGKTPLFLNKVHPFHRPPLPICQLSNQNMIYIASISSVMLDLTVTVVGGKWNYNDTLKISPRTFQRTWTSFNGGQTMQGSIPHLHRLPKTSVQSQHHPFLANDFFLLPVKSQLIDVLILAHTNSNTFKFSNMLGERISLTQQVTILQR